MRIDSSADEAPCWKIIPAVAVGAALVVPRRTSVLPVPEPPRVVGEVTVPVNVGLIEKTPLPVPVSSVKAASKLADVNDPREAAFPTDVIMPVRLALVVTVPAVKPAAVPVMFVPTSVDGVPRLGVTSVGASENTAVPVPLSSDSSAASCAEVVKAAERPSDEVAIWLQVFPAPPIRSWFWVMVDRPVPPLVAASAVPLQLVLLMVFRIARAPSPRLVRAPRAVEDPVPPLLRSKTPVIVEVD